MNTFKSLIMVSIILMSIFFFLKKRDKGLKVDEIAIFLENVMIREGGLYTLIGTKPLTIFRICPEISDFLQRENAIDLESFYQKEVDDNFSYFSTLDYLKHDKLWDAWVKEKIPLDSYTYIMASRISSYSNRPMGIFVNIPNAIYILSSNYELFKRETGLSFDPYIILKEIESNASEFWEKVFKNHYLLGILLGYGTRNSFIFNWTVILPNHVQNTRIKKKNSDYIKNERIRYGKKITVQDLALPQFFCFDIYEETLDKYKKEKHFIIKNFKGYSFKNKVLEYLCNKESKSL